VSYAQSDQKVLAGRRSRAVTNANGQPETGVADGLPRRPVGVGRPRSGPRPGTLWRTVRITPSGNARSAGVEGIIDVPLTRLQELALASLAAAASDAERLSAPHPSVPGRGRTARQTTTSTPGVRWAAPADSAGYPPSTARPNARARSPRKDRTCVCASSTARRVRRARLGVTRPSIVAGAVPTLRHKQRSIIRSASLLGPWTSAHRATRDNAHAESPMRLPGPARSGDVVRTRAGMGSQIDGEAPHRALCIRGTPSRCASTRHRWVCARQRCDDRILVGSRGGASRGLRPSLLAGGRPRPPS
jgi:hypothetical protein